MRNEQPTDYTLLSRVVTDEPMTTISYGKRWGFEQVLQASMGGVVLLFSETRTAFRQSCGLR